MKWFVKSRKMTAAALLFALITNIPGMPVTVNGAEGQAQLVKVDEGVLEPVDEVTALPQDYSAMSVNTISGAVTLTTTNAASTTGAAYDFTRLEKALSEIQDMLGTKGTATVTEVYSINNRLKDCYYKPLLDEIYMLEEYVMLQGNAASAYTGFFDLTADAPNTGHSECRELEILGYDFLLSNEVYDGANYTATRVGNNISRQTAVMDIYKALGIEIQEIQLYHSAVGKADLINSPAVKNLPWLVNDIDPSKGRTDAFITRTRPEYYAEKAKSDLHWSSADVSPSEVITLGEFIVRVADMMDLYGEPVISQAEMNTLVQVFGGNIPSSLSGAQLEAYIYLRSRGILTDGYQVFSSALTFRQMTEILMRVKDTDSRQNLKDIQITMDISDSLVDAGFFPKTVSIDSGRDAVMILENYSYENITTYDYFINVDSAGFSAGSKPYIPVDLENAVASRGFDGSSFTGFETINGVRYAHVRINAANATGYFNSVKEATGMDAAFILVDGCDPDRRVAFGQGGGVYDIAGDKNGSGIYLTSRVPFDADMRTDQWTGYVDAERSRQAAAGSSTVLSRIKDFFGPLTAEAASPDSDPVVELTIFNWSNVDQDPDKNDRTQLDIYSQIYVDAAEDMAVLKMNKSYVDTFRQNIVRKRDDTAGSRTVQSIANVGGDTLIPVRELAEWGLVYEPDVWDLSGNVLTLDTKYGRVVLNQAVYTVVSGTTLYRLSPGTQLFALDQDRELLVDFRAVYGWSANIADITITGTGTGYSIGVTEFDSDNKAVPLQRRDIAINSIFNNDSNNVGRKAMFTPSGIATAAPGYLMVSNYQFANWMTVDSYNTTENALYVFYHKDAFINSGLSVPDDPDAAAEAEKYMLYKIIGVNDWVVRRFPLDFRQHNEAGEVTYIQQYGYVYNVPEESDFSYEKYLRGDCMLPLYFGDNKGSRGNASCQNANVNIWGGLPYGTRDYGSSDTGPPTRYTVDWKGQTGTVTGTTQNIIKATPAGVQALFGGLSLNYADISSYQNLITAAKDGGYTAMYFGTCKLTPNSTGNKVSVRIPNNGFQHTAGPATYICTHTLDGSTMFYEMARWKGSSSARNWYSRYIHFGSIMDTKTAGEVRQDMEAAQRNPVEISAEEYEEGYGGFDGFSLEYLLHNVDLAAYWVLFIAVKILPVLMIIALTLVMGIAMMSDNKIVQKIVAKTFDPVKLLTFGRRTFTGMSRKQSFITLMTGYLVFVLIVDGNILKIIMLLSGFADTVAKMLRNM